MMLTIPITPHENQTCEEVFIDVQEIVSIERHRENGNNKNEFWLLYVMRSGGAFKTPIMSKDECEARRDEWQDGYFKLSPVPA